MSESDLSYYDLLGVSPNATDAEIERAYRALLPKVHPDISRLDNLDTHRLAAVVNQAWLTLHDPEKRKAYDESLRSAGQPAPPTAAPAVEELSDRARAYVEQLEKSRTYWDATRKRAEEERIAREREAHVLAQARETAKLSEARRIGAATPSAELRHVASVPPASGLPRVHWSTALFIVAVLVIVASGAWLLLRPHGSYSSAVGPTQYQPQALATHRATATPATTAHESMAPAAQPTASAIHPLTHGALSRASVAPYAPPSATGVPTPRRTAAAVAIAPKHAVAAPAHQASACRESRVSAIVNGSIVETGDGSYRVDDPAMQQLARTWTAGDAVTICMRTAQDGSSYALLANGVRGTVQAVQVTTPAATTAYGNPPVCTSATVTRVADEGATVLTRDGRSFHINDNEGMRTETRSWGTPVAVTICSTMERDGSIHASIVASDTISVQATLQKSH